MTTAMADQDLLALAEKAEAAIGPDREIDKAVAGAIGMCLHPRQTKNGYQDDWGYDCDDCGADSWGNRSKDGFSRRLSDPAPAYTASLDAAMTLVPEGVEVGWRMTDGAGGPTAEIWSIDLDAGCEKYHVGANPCATPALALTAAALRARATIKEGESRD